MGPRHRADRQTEGGRGVPWALLTAVAIPTALVGGFLLARGQLNDESVPQTRVLPGVGEGVTVLAIWAHPDDEITCAGTLAQMVKAGARVVLVYLTRGEAAQDTGYAPAALAKVRIEEAKAAGRLLGADAVEVLDFPDGGLSRIDPAGPKAAIAELIGRYRPQVLVSFDEKVGFYGHPDHVRTGAWVRELFESPPRDGAWPRLLYQVTLPKALVRLALRLVEAFRNNYPKGKGQGLPPPQMAVNIAYEAHTKRALLDVHASQAKIIADVQPYYDRLPAWLYYRLFDREYFVQLRRR
ncbi:PIG-L deacetylase family protein [Phenylobacterium sp.]|uniref:PIG-L deacetylase family protein n=1 Tax=Phenylobacterium sp. TaxID=1871053 RepID=UPI0027312349|nr:PIG-L family deacetylase [Phenylobacterium sp.]MDP1874890.1 PIG-L family deacetylase [Phenylobacterium sp.]